MKGKKTCPKCKESLGVRTGVCPKCQYVFEKKAIAEIPPEKHKVPAAAPTKEATPADRGNNGFRVVSIATPAGRCPAKALTGVGRDEIEIWAQIIISAGLEENKRYMLSALRYWLRESFEIGSPEYQQAWDVLGDIFQAA